MERLVVFREFEIDLLICKEFFGSKGIEELDKVIAILRNGKKLSPKYKDHALNTYKEFRDKGYRDCHIVTISDDWVLVYHPMDKSLGLIRTGIHSQIFKMKQTRN